MSVIEWRRVDKLGGRKRGRRRGEEGTEALVINLCRGEVHRSAANAHIMRRCVQSRYLHLHIYVYSILYISQWTPGTPPSAPLPLSPSLLDDNLFLFMFAILLPFPPLIILLLYSFLATPTPPSPPDPPKISPFTRDRPCFDSHHSHPSKSTTLRSTSGVTQPRISASGPSEASLVHA